MAVSWSGSHLLEELDVAGVEEIEAARDEHLLGAAAWPFHPTVPGVSHLACTDTDAS